MDDKTMHELYMWPFADAVHAGVASVSKFSCPAFALYGRLFTNHTIINLQCVPTSDSTTAIRAITANSSMGS